MVKATGVAEHAHGASVGKRRLVGSTLGDPTFKGCAEEEAPGRGSEKKMVKELGGEPRKPHLSRKYRLRE